MTLKKLLSRVYDVPLTRIRADTPLSMLSADPHAHIRLALTLDLDETAASKVELHPEKWTLAKLTKAIKEKSK